MKEELAETKRELKEVTKELQMMNKRIIDLEANKSTASNPLHIEEFLAEVEERKYRAMNVMIANIKESSKTNHIERLNEEKETVLNIFKDVTLTDTNIRLQRIGKFSKDKCRLLKVTFKNPADAKETLKISKTLKIVKIFGDQTVKQREYYKVVKKRLQEIISTGDNSKTIKYINSIPTIVE